MRKKSFFKFILSAVVMSVILSSISVNFSVFADSNDNSPITYVSNRKDVKDTVETFAEEKYSKIKLKLDKNLENNNNYQTVWIDGELMNSSKVKNKLQDLYNRGCKIVIRKDFLPEMEVLNYFNLSPKGLFLSDINENEDLKRIGVCIQKLSDGSFDIIGINSKINYTESQNEDLMLFVSKNKFTHRLRGKVENKNLLSSLFEGKTAHATEWEQVNIASAVDGQMLVDVSYAMTMAKDTSNPINGSKYYTCRKTTVEAIPHSTSDNPGVAINDINIWTDGDNGHKKSGAEYPCKILDYTPMNNGSTDSSGQISLTYPWGVSFAFNVGGVKANYSTSVGGLGTSYVQVHFWPSSKLKDKRFSGCVTSEMYQDSSTNTDPTYFKSNMKYTIATQNYIARPNTYYNESASHWIAGR